MGRAFLSTKYDAARPVTPVIQQHPPKYVDAPFDLDSDFDSDDVVYEAFCTPEEYKDRLASQENQDASSSPPAFSPSPTAPSPSDPVGTRDNDERARTLPYFPTFIQRLADGREIQTESPLPNLPRLVSELRPVLSHPEVQAVLPNPDLINPLHSSETQEEIHQRVIRIRQVLRPHILYFLGQLPMVSDSGYIAGLVERALVLDALGARGLDYFEAITRLGEDEGLEGIALTAPPAPTYNPALWREDPSLNASNVVPNPSGANITINPSEWWLERGESRSPPTFPIHIRAEFAPSLAPPDSTGTPQNYHVQDPDASDSSSGSSRPESPADDPLPPRPVRLATGSSSDFLPRTSIPSSGQMFAAFTEMAGSDRHPRAFTEADWYNYPLYSGPLH